MKFLIVLSIFALSASQVTPLFFGGHGRGKKPAADPVPVAAPAPSSGGGGLAGLGSIVAIPLGIKKQLLASHQKRINKHFDHIIKTLNSFSSSLGGGSSSSSGATAEVGVSTNGNVGGSVGGNRDFDNFESAGPNFHSTDVGGGFDAGTSFGGSNSFSQSGNVGGGFETSGNVGGGFATSGNVGGGFETSGGGFESSSSQNLGSSGTYRLGNSGGGDAHIDVRGGGGGSSNVQTYHPQPAPNVQYKDVPITVHLYQVEVPQAVAAPAPQSYTRAETNSFVEEQAQFDETPVVAPQRTYGAPVPFVPAPAPFVPAPAPIAPAPVPIAPANTYGPPNYNPPAPVNSYLPPTNCNNPTHRHK